MEAQVAVVGLGSMGSMALWQLARRGVRAIGFEQFEPGHDLGSGHGESRIIRSCYAEGAQYVPLLQAAFPLWRELEAETGARLLIENGALYVGRPDTGYIVQCRHTAEAHGLPHQILDAEEVRRRYPQHHLENGEVGFLDERAGLLRPEAAVRAAAARAAELGARVVTGSRVLAIEERGDGIELRTAGDTCRAQQVIVSVGAWLGKLLPEIRLSAWVERQVMVWFRARRPELFSPDRFPVFIRERGAGRTWYGFPSLDGATVKAALHHDGPEADPDHLDREIHPADTQPVAALVASSLPGLEQLPVRAKACMYTNSGDGHFVIGRPALHDRLVLLGAMSGHGFKFAAVIGRIAAGLAVDGATGFDLTPFSPDRFASFA